MSQGIALLRPNYRRLSEDQPYGTPHACFQMCKAIAELGRYDQVDIYDEELKYQGASYPFTSQGEFRCLNELSLYLDDYRCVYLSNDLMNHVSYNFRLDHQRVPMIADIGTAHMDEQWKHIFLAAITGKVTDFDGFVFKSERARDLFSKTVESWKTQFDIRINPPVTYIPNGIDILENQRSQSLRQACREYFMFHEDDVVFLAFNRIAPTLKIDYDSLIWNWREVVRQNPRARLLIAGAKVSMPDYRHYPVHLRNLARKAGLAQHVVVLENPYEIFPNARTTLMSAADAFIHTAKGIQETSSLTILEAMSHSLPVIVGDWSGAGALVQAGETGLIVKTINAEVPMDLEANAMARSALFYNGDLEESVACDAGELIRAVGVLSGNAELRQKMGQQARAAVEASYTLEKTASQRVDFFESCVERAQETLSSPLGRGRKIFSPDLIVEQLSGRRILPGSILSCGVDDREWMSVSRWADNADLAMKILDTLRAHGELAAGEIFAHIFGQNCRSGSHEWVVFSGFLIKMLSIHLIRCVP